MMLEVNFNPFPTLYTDRLILRRITFSDAADFFAIRSNKDIMSAIDKTPIESIAEIESFIQTIEDNLNNNKGIAWAVCLKEDNRMIGHFGFHRIDFENHRAEIGYALLPQFQRLGLANEGIKAALDCGFMQLGFHSIEADVNPINNASMELLLKNGFVKEAHFKENYFFNGVFLDSTIFSLLKKDYLSNVIK